MNGKPLLEHILLYLRRNEIFDICINLHTMPDKITSYFKEGSNWGIRIHYVHEDVLSGTAGALPRFRDWLREDRDFLVMYGDILTNQPLAPIKVLHQNSDAFATLLLHRRQSSNSFVELSPEGRVINFIERPSSDVWTLLQRQHPKGFLVNSAIQFLNSHVLDYIEKHNCFDLPRDVYMKVFR